MNVIGEITAHLESIAPLHLQAKYDNAGLLTGNKSWAVSGVLCCLDATEAVVDEAIALGCNLIVAHHPIIFSGLKSLTGSNYIERTILKALKNDIAIYAIHTNLDHVLTGGVNQKIAERLSLHNVAILDPDKKDPSIGAGIVGELASSMTEQDFLSYAYDHMQANVIRHSPMLGKRIKKVAICGGSGSFLLERAIASEADVFITGDFKYHQFFDANDDILILDIGHFESEQFTIDLLYDHITNKFSKFAAHCTKVTTNPIGYYYK